MDRKKEMNFRGPDFAVTRVLPVSMLAALMVLLLALGGCQSGGITSKMATPRLRPATQTSRLMQNADYLRKSGRLELAVAELEEARLQEPDNLKILDLLARCYEDLGYFKRAQEVYDQALSQAGYHPALENNRCYSLYLQGRLHQAEACFRKVLAREPANQTARNNLGLVLCRQGREAEALALWREALSDPEARQLLGQALTALGREVPPTIADEPLVAAAPTIQAAKKKEDARSETQPSAPLSPSSGSVSPGPSTKTSSVENSPSTYTTPEAAALVAQLPNSKEDQAQLSPQAKAATSPSPPADTPQPPGQAPAVASATEINPKSAAREKLVAKENPVTAPALASPEPPPSPVPERTVAETSPDPSEPLSTSKIEVPEPTPAPTPALTEPELPETGSAVAAAPAELTVPAAEPEKEAALPAPKPPAKTNLRASTPRQPAQEAEVTQQNPPLRQFLSRLVRLLTKGKFAARASSAGRNTQASTAVPMLNKAKETQASAVPRVTDQQNESGASAASLLKQEDTIASIPALTSQELYETRIELKNGNGVQNHARHARSILSWEGFTVVAIGNHIDFGLEETVIAYRPEAARTARVLAQKFFPEAKLEANGKMSRNADIRVSLGHDLTVADQDLSGQRLKQVARVVH